MYQWFIMDTFHTPQLGYWQVLGISFLISFLTMRVTLQNPDGFTIFKGFLSYIMTQMLVFIMAFIVHLIS